MTQITQSRLAFGCMQFGGPADATASRAMFEACLAAGIRHFDTACGYTNGASETLLGEFAQGHDLFVATKVGYHGGAGRANLLAQFDASRKRLQMDSVDLLYLHRFDPETPLQDTLETFADLQARGLVRHIGLSNFAAWQVMKAQAIAHGLGTRIAAIQPMYSLVKRQAEVELLPMAADQGISAFTYSPLGAGLLSGKYTQGSAGRLTEDSRYATRYAPETMHETARALADLAAHYQMHPATLAVAWVMAHPSHPVPIISARNLDQLNPSLAAATFALTGDLYARISALSPKPPPATDRLDEA